VKPDRSANSTLTKRRSASAPSTAAGADDVSGAPTAPGAGVPGARGATAGGAFVPGAGPAPSGAPQRGQKAKSGAHVAPHAAQGDGCLRPHFGQNAKSDGSATPQPAQGAVMSSPPVPSLRHRRRAEQRGPAGRRGWYPACVRSKEDIEMDAQTPLATPRVGDPAPLFRLPTAQGPELGPADYRGKQNLVLWFSAGLFCPFCRRSMAQLRRGYDEIRSRNAEVLQVTHNTPQEARQYFQRYALSFPYLCDAARGAHEAYGLPLSRVPLATGLGRMATGMALTAIDKVRGEPTPSLEPAKRLGNQDPVQAVFLVDRDGIVRAVHTTGGTGGLPTVPELVTGLAAL
jgi:peroxiredoxin